ncbi:hypothetical protein FACS1894132_07870 [Clostridia bacterium]|nr:hypothetical protein FACS1894132_07870 [Clostridia bacterium]
MAKYVFRLAFLKREKEIRSHYGLFGYKQIGKSTEELQKYFEDVYVKREQ